MKKTKNPTFEKLSGIILMLFVFTFIFVNGAFSQEKQSVRGKLIEKGSSQPVSSATVAIMKETDSKLIGGTMSDESGEFNITPVTQGRYILKVSSIGYKPATIAVDVMNETVTDAGTIMLQDTSLILSELIVTGERIKAKSESDKTTFFVTKKMMDVSNTGTDVLKLIPGIQVDLLQNISLEGSSNIQIFVDGKERDKSFVSQLNPSLIDQIDIISVPPSNYDGNVTGAINIILKKDLESGISGHVLLEVPVSSSEVYLFPAYSLNYTYKKLNLYISYNGEITRLNLQENTKRMILNDPSDDLITIDQALKQKEWSHRFHYGFDYFLSDRDQINFYSFINPYSRELDGNANFSISGTDSSTSQAEKEDTDSNTSTFYSLYYKHNFEKRSAEFTADISNYSMRAENRTDYTFEEPENNLISETYSVKPKQNSLSIRMDFKTTFLEKFTFSTGAKAKFQSSSDLNTEFDYTENILALYGNFAWKNEKLDVIMGLRAEKSVAELKDSFKNPALCLLPNSTFRYKLTKKQSLQLSFNRSITRPNIYQLNPSTFQSDPFTINKGNPFLKPELSGKLILEHSIQFNGNYFSSRLFGSRQTDVINSLMIINNADMFETQVHNLGTSSQLGLQFTGSLKTWILTFNPYARIYDLKTEGNEFAKLYSIEKRNIICLESGLSAIATFKHDLALSLTLQYNSKKNDIQGSSFSDMLYFCSVEKTIKQKFKVGIVTAIPFTRSFTYQGSEIYSPDFSNNYQGNVRMSVIPLWIKLAYQFNSGKNREKINRTKEEIDNRPKKGF